MPRILTVTLNPTVDLSSRTEIVRPVRKVRTEGERFDPGGGGINVARVMVRLGRETEAVYFAGGEIGGLLDRLLEQDGIPRHRVDIAGQTRIGYVVFENSTGLEYRFVPEGPTVSSAELEALLAVVRRERADYLVASGSLCPGAQPAILLALSRIAAEAGARFVVDSSGAALRAVLDSGRPYLVKPSRSELEALVGRKLDAGDIADAARKLVADGKAEMVAVTLGGDGGVLATATGTLTLPGIPVKVLSAVGAGDSFLAAMVWALADGHPPETAFRYGIAAGAATALTPGTELCYPTDVMRLYRDAYGTG